MLWDAVQSPQYPILQLLKIFNVHPSASIPISIASLPAPPAAGAVALMLFPVTSDNLPLSWPLANQGVTIAVNGTSAGDVPHPPTRSSAARTLAGLDITRHAQVGSSLVMSVISTGWSSTMLLAWCGVKTVHDVVEEARTFAMDCTTAKVRSSKPAAAIRTNTLHSGASHSMGCERQGDAADVDSAVVEVSLRCPLSHGRIVIPARGVRCEHESTFDLDTFVRHALQVHSWNCPVCDGPVGLRELRVHSIVAEALFILSDLSLEVCDRIHVWPDGRWDIGSITKAKNLTKAHDVG